MEEQKNSSSLTIQANKADEFQTVTNRRRPPRRKEPPAQEQKGTPTAGAHLENQNRFDALQEDEVQAPEATATEEEPSPDGELPEPVAVAAPAAPEAVGLVESGSPSKRVDSDSSRSDGKSESDSIPVPSPPVTRGRKTNKERREKEAATNIMLGSQKKLDTFVKGHT